jgi:predicted ATPase
MKSGLEIKKKAVLKSFKTNKQGNLECSICKSSLTEHSKEAVKHHYDDELTTLNVRISEVSIKLIEKLSKIDKIKALKDQMEKTATKLSSSLSFVQTNLIALERALSNNKESLELASSAFNEELLLKLKKELIELRASLKEHEKQLKINVAWKQIVSKNGLRLSYIKEEINVLNALASQYATIVYEKPMQVKFFINDEKDNPTLDFTINGRNSGMFSTGEKGRLEISMTLSLLSLLKTAGFNMSVLVLDEALDGLSEASKLAVLKVVDSLSHEYQIILISHDELVKTKPGYAIQVIKDGATETSTISTAIQKFEQV